MPNYPQTSWEFRNGQRLWSRLYRQAYRERRAFAKLAAHRHSAAQQFGERLDDVETQADTFIAAGLRAVDLMEALEDFVAFVRRDSYSAVGHSKLDPVLGALLIVTAFSFRRDHDAAFFGKLDGIVDPVGENRGSA